MSENTNAPTPNNAERTCPTCGRPIGAAPAPSGIGSLRPGSTASFEATVAAVYPPRQVATSRGPAEVADAKLEDGTGAAVKLVLWNEQISKVRVGQKVRLAGAWVREYRGHLQVSLGRDASMAVLGP